MISELSSETMIGTFPKGIRLLLIGARLVKNFNPVYFNVYQNMIFSSLTPEFSDKILIDRVIRF